MNTIIIENLQSKAIHCNTKTKKLLEILQENQIDWMQACGGKGRCTTCKAIIHEGFENFSPLSPFEERCRENNAIKENERLSCQAEVTGDVIISVPEQYKLPHLTYSN